jgi:hypothetical protein
MDLAAERNFELRREAASGHIRMDLDASGDKASIQKDLSPKGFAKNGPATSLLLSPRSTRDMLLRRASSAGRFWRNSNIHSFLTGC